MQTRHRRTCWTRKCQRQGRTFPGPTMLGRPTSSPSPFLARLLPLRTPLGLLPAALRARRARCADPAQGCLHCMGPARYTTDVPRLTAACAGRLGHHRHAEPRDMGLGQPATRSGRRALRGRPGCQPGRHTRLCARRPHRPRAAGRHSQLQACRRGRRCASHLPLPHKTSAPDCLVLMAAPRA